MINEYYVLHSAHVKKNSKYISSPLRLESLRVTNIKHYKIVLKNGIVNGINNEPF